MFENRRHWRTVCLSWVSLTLWLMHASMSALAGGYPLESVLQQEGLAAESLSAIPRTPRNPPLQEPAKAKPLNPMERLPPPVETQPKTPPLPAESPMQGMPPIAPPHLESFEALPAAPMAPVEPTTPVDKHQQHSFEPEYDCGIYRAPYFHQDFSDDPINYQLPYDACAEAEPYATKSAVKTQRPWIELGRPFYGNGQLPPAETWLGKTNPVIQQFLLYGDFRTAIASNDNGGNSTNQVATRLNLEADWRITSTERFHASFQPLNRGQNFTHLEFDSNSANFDSQLNADFVTGFLEADLGGIWGGLTGKVLPFELPIAVGSMPILFQNGIWMDDNVVGAAVTLPAKNSPRLDIANFDITFFYLFDNINSPAFQGDNSAAKAYGVASFLEAADGYFEIDYAFLEDRTQLDRSYHNLGFSYTRRYFHFLSNSMRVIANVGQDPNGIDNTADGLVFLSENSLITSNPYLFVPYFNTFTGFRRTQSVARNGAAGGILRNTGILFESDNLTGYPTLDSSANETFGGAIGINMLPATIDRQLVLEYAFVGLLDDTTFQKINGNQHGIATRFQRNLSNTWLFRADAMYGFLQNQNDVSGVRCELRAKF